MDLLISLIRLDGGISIGYDFLMSSEFNNCPIAFNPTKGEEMGPKKGFLLMALFLAIISVGVVTDPGLSKEQDPGSAKGVIDVGKPGPEAIGIDARFVAPRKGKFRTGDQVAVEFKTEKKAHALGIYYGPRGDILVFYPNLEQSDTLVAPSKTIKLFQRESNIKLKLSEKTRGAKLVFYVSSPETAPKPMEFTKSEPFVIIPRNEKKEELKALRQRLETMSKDKGFNMVILDFPKIERLKPRGRPKGSAPMKLMGPPPSPSDSSKPAGVSGVAGKSEKEIKPTNE
jgi:hypothetical protein